MLTPFCKEQPSDCSTPGRNTLIRIELLPAHRQKIPTNILMVRVKCKACVIAPSKSNSVAIDLNRRLHRSNISPYSIVMLAFIHIILLPKHSAEQFCHFAMESSTDAEAATAAAKYSPLNTPLSLTHTNGAFTTQPASDHDDVNFSHWFEIQAGVVPASKHGISCERCICSIAGAKSNVEGNQLPEHSTYPLRSIVQRMESSLVAQYVDVFTLQGDLPAFVSFPHGA
ncbi:hypothetical protein B0H63DRAFT_443631 [Podospora didyma]|uniref:Uncharacterized protein n=1 Tax=Podospora didyma TaxID=330526 RepID=A0AAE0U721_9PEZI|nr:hypothetical protein B0H63DRAFT_443631 [Podospora didyma]